MAKKADEKEEKAETKAAAKKHETAPAPLTAEQRLAQTKARIAELEEEIKNLAAAHKKAATEYADAQIEVADAARKGKDVQGKAAELGGKKELVAVLAHALEDARKELEAANLALPR